MASIDAYMLLANDLSIAEKAVNRHVKVPLTQNQFDALTSLTFNIGATGLATSTLLRVLNQGDYDKAAGRFLDFNKSGTPKKIDSGLVNRRNAERELFLKEDH